MDRINVQNICLKFEALSRLDGNEEVRNKAFLNRRVSNTLDDSQTVDLECNINNNVDITKTNVKRRPAFRQKKIVYVNNDNLKNKIRITPFKAESIKKRSNGKCTKYSNIAKLNAVKKDASFKKNNPSASKGNYNTFQEPACNEERSNFSPKIKNNVINSTMIREKESYSIETLKKVMSLPLPRGPPPEKPPRNFGKCGQPLKSNEESTLIKKVNDIKIAKSIPEENRLRVVCNHLPGVNKVNECDEVFRTSRDTKQCQFAGATETSNYGSDRNEISFQKCRKSPHVMLQKIENALYKYKGDTKIMKKALPDETKILKKSLPDEEPSLDYRSLFSCFNTILMSDEIIYETPSVSKSKFFIEDANKANLKKWYSDEHLYAEIKSNNKSKKPGSFNDDNLYYLSTPIDSLMFAPSCDEFRTNKSGINLKENVSNPLRSASTLWQNTVNDKIRRLNETYGRIWNENASDSDSLPSTPDELDLNPLSSIASTGKASTCDAHARENRKSYLKRITSSLVWSHRISNEYASVRKNRLYNALILVGLDMDAKGRVVPYVRKKFPKTTTLTKNIESFVFPDSDGWTTSNCENRCYTITLTSEHGARTYGYCRRIIPEGTNTPLPLAYCILSQRKHNDLYFALLSELEKRHGGDSSEFEEFASILYRQSWSANNGCVIDLPAASQLIKYLDFKNRKNIVGSGDSCENRSSVRLFHGEPTYADLHNALRMMSVNTFLTAFGTLLNERKLILLSASISKLSECIDGLQAALLPFIWQHTVVTIVPALVVSVSDLCDAPTPYLIGVLKSSALPQFDACEDTVIIDVDSQKVIRSIGDESTILPDKSLKALKVALKYALNQEAELSALLATEAFTRLFVDLVGHFKEHIREGPEPFCKAEFVKNARRRNVRTFLDWFCETTMFAEFADTVTMSDAAIGRSLFLWRCEENEKHKRQNAKGNSINKTMKQLVTVASDKFKDLSFI